jgi:hypothetical protein
MVGAQNRPPPPAGAIHDFTDNDQPTYLVISTYIADMCMIEFDCIWVYFRVVGAGRRCSHYIFQDKPYQIVTKIRID